MRQLALLLFAKGLRPTMLYATASAQSILDADVPYVLVAEGTLKEDHLLTCADWVLEFVVSGSDIRVRSAKEGAAASQYKETADLIARSIHFSPLVRPARPAEVLFFISVNRGLSTRLGLDDLLKLYGDEDLVRYIHYNFDAYCFFALDEACSYVHILHTMISCLQENERLRRGAALSAAGTVEEALRRVAYY